MATPRAAQGRTCAAIDGRHAFLVANGGYTAASLRCRAAGVGRVRPTNPLNSLPETCQSSWAAIQLSFVYTGSRPVGDIRVPGLIARKVPVAYVRCAGRTVRQPRRARMSLEPRQWRFGARRVVHGLGRRRAHEQRFHQDRGNFPKVRIHPASFASSQRGEPSPGGERGCIAGPKGRLPRRINRTAAGRSSSQEPENNHRPPAVVRQQTQPAHSRSQGHPGSAAPLPHPPSLHLARRSASTRPL